MKPDRLPELETIMQDRHLRWAEISLRMGVPVRTLASYAEKTGLAKKYPRIYGNAPAAQERVTTDRRCLKCRTTFASEGKHNQVCSPCQRSNARHTNDYSLAI